MKLYELTDAFEGIFDLLDSDNNELNFEALEDTLQSIEGAIEQKAEGIARMILSLEKTADAFGSEAKRLADKKKTTENKVKWLKDYLLMAMKTIAKDKIPTSVGNVCRRKSPPSVSLLDPSKIPNDFWIVPEPVPDKRAILEKLKQRIEIPGAELHQGYHIRIQ